MMGEERVVKGFLFRLLVGVRGVVEPDAAANSDSVTRWTRINASRSSASVCSSKASRLLRTVPEKRTGSWGMIARRERRAWRFMVEMSSPSMWILPSLASRKRKSASVRLDFPAPVRPTTPMRSLRSMLKERPFKTGGRSSA